MECRNTERIQIKFPKQQLNEEGKKSKKIEQDKRTFEYIVDMPNDFES